ncbi:hypothetical protein V1514DRAFT_330446 [Lipomyces japonicus]|uniref:uncharacterized protein n=1 Tax=Lipomyces japonicus TaxID=56871 RepID=UPI0034CDF6A2
MLRVQIIGLVVLATISGVLGLFSVQDDILAFPQYQIDIGEHITEEEVSSLIAENSGKISGLDRPKFNFDILRFEDSRYFCSIPILEQQIPLNASEEEISKTEEEGRLARAQVYGWELLDPLNGVCLYYIAGWWTYSFCHNKEVKQFHQLAQNGARFTPKEDTSIDSYILGTVDSDGNDEERSIGSLGDMHYLIQKIGGGSICDLTGKERKIEIQFHCSQNSQDKIAWIKEVTTCRYQMVVHTSRLCQDVSFLPPGEDRANEIMCRKIVNQDELNRAKAMELDILLAIQDHDIERYLQGTLEKNEIATEVPSSTSSTRQNIESSSARKNVASPDLITSANILIRDIEKQLNDGTFLTPEGKVATADDEFSYSVALVDVNANPIGEVTVIVENGEVQVIVEQMQSSSQRHEEREIMLNQFPQKLKDELREFSGGASLSDIEGTSKKGVFKFNDDLQNAANLPFSDDDEDGSNYKKSDEKSESPSQGGKQKEVIKFVVRDEL